MSGSGFWIFSQLAFRNVWHWNSPGLTVLCSKMWAWKEAEKIQELGKDTRAVHTSRCTEKDKSVWKTYLHAPPLACLSRRLTKHTQVKRILLSMLLFSAHLTQLLNIKRNHDQMSVSSSYCKWITKCCPDTARSERANLRVLCKCLKQCLSKRKKGLKRKWVLRTCQPWLEE